MSIVCDCPAGASIPTINPASCPVDMDQIQKVAFQRVFKTPGVKNQVADITKKRLGLPYFQQRMEQRLLAVLILMRRKRHPEKKERSETVTRL